MKELMNMHPETMANLSLAVLLICVFLMGLITGFLAGVYYWRRAFNWANARRV